MRLLFIVALFWVADAHVRQRYLGSLSIRNANSATANGAASTSGPCGGQNTFGNNGINQVKVGQKVTVGIQYAAGHKSAANVFRLTYLCGKPGAQTLLSGPNAKTTVPTQPEPAADTTVVHNFEFTIPATGTGADAQLCTISLLDQRNWGGCVDLQVGTIAGAPTAAPRPTSAPPVVKEPTFAPPVNGKPSVKDMQGRCQIDNQIMDCSGNCWNSSTTVDALTSTIGNGVCNDLEKLWTIDYNCRRFNCDGGDCKSGCYEGITIPTVAEKSNADLLNGISTYDAASITTPPTPFGAPSSDKNAAGRPGLTLSVLAAMLLSVMARFL